MIALLLLLTLGQDVPIPDRDLFGVCIDAAGDLDGDGCQDLWVGDPSIFAGSDITAGCAWAVSGKTGRRLRRIPAPEGAQEFGWTLASLADIDEDGVRDVAVGCTFAPSADFPSPAYGIGSTSPVGGSKVWVFSGATGERRFAVAGPADDVKLPWYSAGAGPALASAGDWNGDGAGDLAIGWSFADAAGIDRGRVEVVSGKDGARLRSWSGAEDHDRFGFSLALLADLDGDGKSELAAGAVPDHDSNAGERYPSLAMERAGYVRILSSTGAILHSLAGPDGSRRFGLSIAPFADADGDGVQDVLVGQPYPAKRGPAITIWSSKSGKLVRRLSPPELDDWDGGWQREHVSPPPAGVNVSFATRLVTVPDRDGDGLSDILATTPQFFGFVPAGVVSSATGRALARVELHSWGSKSNVGLASCLVGDVDGDGVEDLALGGASIRCAGCDGSVVLVSGRELTVLRTIVRRDMRD
jgi:hypothetical protein